MARLLAGKIRTTRGNWTLIPLFVIFLENSCVADEPHGLARRRSAPVLPGDRGSWGAPLIRIQEQTKDAARLGFPQHLQEPPISSDDPLQSSCGLSSILVDSRTLSKHLLCQR